MGAPTVLLISRDRSSIEEISMVLAGWPEGGFLAVADTADDVEVEALGRVGLMLVHLGEGEGPDPVGRLLWLSSTLRRPIPVLALADDFDADRALSLFRMGVADVLSRSHHRDRLGDVISALCLRRPEEVVELGSDEAGIEVEVEIEADAVPAGDGEMPGVSLAS
jgi:hypothetical protein